MALAYSAMVFTLLHILRFCKCHQIHLWKASQYLRTIFIVNVKVEFVCNRLESFQLDLFALYTDSYLADDSFHVFSLQINPDDYARRRKRDAVDVAGYHRLDEITNVAIKSFEKYKNKNR